MACVQTDFVALGWRYINVTCQGMCERVVSLAGSLVYLLAVTLLWMWSYLQCDQV